MFPYEINYSVWTTSKFAAWFVLFYPQKYIQSNFACIKMKWCMDLVSNWIEETRSIGINFAQYKAICCCFVWIGVCYDFKKESSRKHLQYDSS